MTSLHLPSFVKNNQWWIFVVFAAGVIGPSVVLGGLGLRSFRYETELLRQQNVRRFETFGGEIQLAAQHVIDQTLTDLSLKTQTVLAPSHFETNLYDLLDITKVQAYPLKAIFIFDAQGHMVMPRMAAAMPAPPSSMSWGSLENDVRALEDLEFKQKRIEEAANGYLKLAKMNIEDVQKLNLLKNAAAAFRKIGRNGDAESIYKEIIQHHGKTLDVTGKPAGFLAAQRLIDLYDGSGNHKDAESVQIMLGEILVSGKWDLSQSDETKLFASLPPVSSNGGTAWKHLVERMNKRELMAEQAPAFIKNDWPALFQSLVQQGWRDKGGVLHRPDDKLSYSIIVPVKNIEGSDQHGFVVGIIPAASMRTDIQHVSEILAAKAGFTWTDVSEQTQPLKEVRSKTILTKQLDNVAPPLLIHLTLPSDDIYTALLRKRVRNYGSMSVLSLLVTLAGLGLMFHSIRRERENAELKAEFVSNVSHELRTPLTSIAYISERLRLGQYKSPQEVKEFYGMLGDEASHLTEMIEAVLDFSRMMEGKREYHRQKANVVDVARIACDRFQTKATANGFQLNVALPSNPIWISMDKKAVIQAILNLLDNALKYSGESKKIDVTVELDGEYASVSVQDFGIGIALKDQGKIFEKFYRVESVMRRTSAGGVGLGLAIVKHVVDGHGGNVSIKSEEGVGSTFTLRFPVQSQINSKGKN